MAPRKARKTRSTRQVFASTLALGFGFKPPTQVFETTMIHTVPAPLEPLVRESEHGWEHQGQRETRNDSIDRNENDMNDSISESSSRTIRDDADGDAQPRSSPLAHMARLRRAMGPSPTTRRVDSVLKPSSSRVAPSKTITNLKKTRATQETKSSDSSGTMQGDAAPGPSGPRRPSKPVRQPSKRRQSRPPTRITTPPPPPPRPPATADEIVLQNLARLPANLHSTLRLRSPSRGAWTKLWRLTDHRTLLDGRSFYKMEGVGGNEPQEWIADDNATLACPVEVQRLVRGG